MALTKDDLQSISKIIKDGIKSELYSDNYRRILRSGIRKELYSDDYRQVIRDEVKSEISPLKEDIIAIKDKVDAIWEALNEDLISNLTLIEKLSKEVKKLKDRVNKLELVKS